MNIYIILTLVCILLIIAVWISTRIICNGKKNISEEMTVLSYGQESNPYYRPVVLKYLLNDVERQNIMDYAKSRLEDSVVISGLAKAVRNSKQCWIPKDHPLAQPLYQKLSKLINIPIENTEDLQVVRYLPGQFYNEHHDACCDDNNACYNFVDKRGQRKLTVLVYLNNEFTGGHTNFPKLDLKIRADPGDAVVFHTLESNSSKCHPLALHAGMPVTSGEKWIANIWYRENKF